ncbi:MAG: mechanosensitive ion channel family protein [Candidatus Micrarchaeota archaeon]|nr:mechanosensitive ion channel family protein [Candidatus Micrarchaeota archaeon]
MDALNHPILEIVFFDNPIKSYLIALLVFLATYTILKIFKFVLLKKLKEWAKKSSTRWDDVIVEIVDMIGWPFYMLVSLYIALGFLTVPEIVTAIVKSLLIIVSAFYGIKIVLRIIEELLHIWNERRKEKLDPSLIQMLHTLIKAALWTIAIITVLANLGYDISVLLAGVSITSLAVAFAFQRIMEDLFAYFVIHIDKPFKVGDTVFINGEGGTVKQVGLKSTRIVSLKNGEELVVSNAQLLNSWIHNYGRIYKRRHAFMIGVTYETPVEKLKQIPKMVEEIVKEVGGDKVEFERCVFKSYGDFSLNYEVVFHVDEKDYNKYLKIVEEIYLKIKERFDNEGIEFAYPTQTIFLKSSNGENEERNV